MFQLDRQLGLEEVDVLEEENTTNTGREDGERTSSMKKSTCKTQLRSRMKRAHSRREKGKALGAYQKCIRHKR